MPGAPPRVHGRWLGRNGGGELRRLALLPALCNDCRPGRMKNAWPILPCVGPCAALAVLALTGGIAGRADLRLRHPAARLAQPHHRIAIAKVLKEKAGMNVLVQPTAGDTAIIPMVGRGEAEIGIANIMEVAGRADRLQDLRLIARSMRCARRFSCARTPACDEPRTSGKRVAWGYSAMRDHRHRRARHARTPPGLTEADVKPVLVPNVVRSADDFVAGTADMFFFAFGAPKMREVDVDRRRHPRARDPMRAACRRRARSCRGAI